MEDDPVRATLTVDAGALVTLTPTTDDVAVAPPESVTRAVRDTGPAAAGDHVVVYGALNAVPMAVLPARKSTREIVFPVPGVAVAVSVTTDPVGTEVPLLGAVKETVGETVGVAETVTLTGDDVTGAPLESVTRAVNETVPAAVGVQLTE